MKNKTMMFKQDRRRFWKNLTINIIKLNPARATLLPVVLTTISSSVRYTNTSNRRTALITTYLITTQ